MTNHDSHHVVRRVARALALAPAALLLTAAGPALAAPPEQWEQAPDVKPIEALLVFVVIPLGLVAVISLLAALPSMTRGQGSYQPGLAWRHEPEWFGGPRDGLEKADRTPPEALESSKERGGASGHW